MKWAHGWVAVLCAMCFARTGEAAEIRWMAPPDCSDARSTIEEAERLLGRPLSSVERLDFDVRVSESGGRWSLKLTTVQRATGERRDRSLTGQSCDEVTAAAAVAIAMVVNADDAGHPEGEALAGGSESPDGGNAAVPPPPAPVAKAPTASTRPASPAPKLGVSVLLAAEGDVGALPNPGFGGEVGAALDYKALRITALGGVLFSSSEDSSGAGGDFNLAFGALLACGRRVLGTVAAALCAGVEAGQLTGTGTGINHPRSGSSAWLAPRADLGIELPLGGDFAFFGRLGATVPTIRKDFLIDDATLIHRPAAVTGRLALGLELRLE